MNLYDSFTKYSEQSKTSFFMSFEGIEGSGKTTQIQKTKEFLTDLGFEVTVLREPGGTKLGEKIRQILLGSEEKIFELSELLLFTSSRAELLSKKVLPLLKEERKIVILDRYFDSSLAYQGVARGLGIETVIKAHSFSPLNILPDFTFYLEISLETSSKRQEMRGNKKDYFEREDKKFYEDLIKGYQKASEIFKNRIIKINAEETPERVEAEIKNFLLTKIK